MAKYVFRDGEMVNKDTGEPMLTPEERSKPLQTPKTFADAVGYQSPVTGEWIEGKRARAYDLEKHGCIPTEDLEPYNKKPRKFKNKKFVEKRGIDPKDLHEGAR